MQAVIEGIDCALGELRHPYHDVVNFEALLTEYGYPDSPALFGWGDYRKTEGDIFDLGIQSAARTLARCEVSPDEIDFVYFCSTCFPGDEIQHIGYNARVLNQLGLVNAFPIGITLNNCTSFLSAIVMAANVVSGGRYTNVLIITADKVYNESIRMNNFALLSDAAASCVVTSRDSDGYRLVADIFRASDDPMHSNHGRDDAPLYRRVFNEIMEVAELRPEQIRQVFCSNIFRSVTMMKERKLGLSKSQIFLDNVARYGHCFSADNFINLIDYEKANPAAAGDHFMISADAPNLRASLMLRKT